jgi:transcription initiation factor TFIIB
VTNAYRVLNATLEIPTQVVIPQSLISKLAIEFDVSERVRASAHDLTERAKASGVANGRKSSGVAAACIYIASGTENGRLTQERIAECAGVKATTLCARAGEFDEMG